MVVPPTKTLKFDPPVVAVLRDQACWSEDGLSVTLPPLERKLYQQVAKAFDRMGGTWNRKAGATLFTADPRDQVEGLIDSGKLVVEKDGFFRTPPDVTRYIMSHMALGTADYNWLEPEAGDGAMVKVLLDEGYPAERIYCIERNASRCEELRKLGVRVANGDLLKFRNSAHTPFHRIIMNPPFEKQQDILHVMKAYHLLAGRGVLAAILSEGAFFRETGLAREFRRWIEAIGAYQEKLPEGSFKESGTMVSTRFVILRK